jgi:hypothetical protein
MGTCIYRDTGNNYRPAVTGNLPLHTQTKKSWSSLLKSFFRGRTCPTPHSSVNA